MGPMDHTHPVDPETNVANVAPENRPFYPIGKEKVVFQLHPFSGATSMLVSGRVQKLLRVGGVPQIFPQNAGNRLEILIGSVDGRNQLMVHSWFGARWFGIRIGVHPSNNPFHEGIPGIQTTKPNQQLTIS